MFFGQYLLDKKLITEAQLIEAVAEQLESRPSILRMILQDKIVATDKLINVIEESIKLGKSIEELLVNQKLIDATILADLNDKTAKKGQGLGRILVKMGAIEAEKLNEQLRVYSSLKPDKTPAQEVPKSQEDLSSSSQDGDEVEISSAALESLRELGISDETEIASLTEKVVSHSSDSNENDFEISSAALESLRELGISDDSEIAELSSKVKPSVVVQETTSEDDVEISSAALESLKELGLSAGDEIAALESKVKGLEFEGVTSSSYLDVFNQDLYETLSADIKSLAKGFNSEILESLHSQMSSFVLVAADEGYKYSEKLFHCYQKVFEAVLDKKIDFSKINFLEFATVTKQALKLAWELKEEIVQSGVENALLNDHNWKKNYLENLKKGLHLIQAKESA